MALTTKAAVKVRMNISTTDFDDRIDALILSVQAWAEKHCGRLFDSTERTLYPSIGGVTTTLRVNAWPITAVASLHASGDTPAVYDATTLLVEDTDYVVDGECGIIERIGCYWPRRIKQVKLVYTGGYSTIPDDLAEAAIESVAVKLRKFEGNVYHIYSESRDDGSLTGILRDDIPSHAMAVFDSYRTPGIG